MACHHKFKEYINLERLDFEPTTLIVGTFNPEWPESNYAEWFYGRTSNNYFWEVLPRIYGEPSLIHASPAEWKHFCKQNKIAITDLIASIEDADMCNPLHISQLKTYSDNTIAKAFKSYTFVKIDKLLADHPSIKHVYLTRGTGASFWKNLWKPVSEYAPKNGLKETTLLTPSGFAFYQQGKYNKLNPASPLNLEDFILKEWKSKWNNYL